MCEEQRSDGSQSCVELEEGQRISYPTAVTRSDEAAAACIVGSHLWRTFFEDRAPAAKRSTTRGYIPVVHTAEVRDGGGCVTVPASAIEVFPLKKLEPYVGCGDSERI